MIGYLLGGLFGTILTGYTTLTLATCLPPVDQRMRTWLVGRRPMRSLLPFWGLFAQQTGIFDLDIWCRVTGSDGTAGPWTQLTNDRRDWLSPVWRPRQRADHTARVLAVRLLQAGGLHDNPGLTISRPYRRILSRVRDEFSATGVAGRAPDLDDRVQFAVRLSRGRWTRFSPVAVFTSQQEPRAAPDAGKGAR